MYSDPKLEIVEGLGGIHFLVIEYKREKKVYRIPGGDNYMEQAIAYLVNGLDLVEDYDYDYHCCY